MSKLKILVCGYGFTSQYLISNFDQEYRILSRNFIKPMYKLNDDFLPDVVIDTIPPVYKNNQMSNPLYKEILLNLYNKKKFLYVHISSTSVYPDINAEYDEKTPFDLNLLSTRGKKRWDLENYILQYFPYALIIRSGGIYGPGRNLILSLKNQNFNHLPEENKIVYRIHIYDLCSLILYTSQMIIMNGLEKSVFPGYNRNNVINAVYPENEPIKNVLYFIKEHYKISIPEKFFHLNEPIHKRIIRSIYLKNFNFRFSDFRKGFIQCFS
ncbi:MAG: hypothetical protein KatS3mg129_0842 [Leptospiraceae bacterium]|nr:MAG: hypothetical protein KatS3mg129_0842 [Leptospiraceae bacterium]